MKEKLLFLSLLLLLGSKSKGQLPPKREFRGAWIQCVNNQFKGLSPQEMRNTLSYQLDELKKSGINTIIFQVRAEGDALYASPYEPWSRYLSGQQGLPPNPYWDPLEWMIAQSHARGMELHAWINPFRAKTKGTPALTSSYYQSHPERFFAYDGLWLFDPAIPENRTYISHIAADIVRRYDVDGLHIDDYFYPYPAAGQPIPDDNSYARYGAGMPRADWRRMNVNAFIQEISDSIHKTKPWVKFGVSPFGIYRNQRSTGIGSRTNGLQNYDDLYADILLWIQRGWIDYNIPQIYWQIGHPSADYEELLRWWNHYAGARPLIIGQDVERTIKYASTNNTGPTQIYQKYDLQRQMPNVVGSCQWYAKACVDNPQGYATALRQSYHRYAALQPQMPWLDNKAPRKIRRPRLIWTADGPVLMWKAPRRNTHPMQKARQYVIYRFAPGENKDTGNPANIYAITNEPFIRLPYQGRKEKWVYVITALDRLQNESKARSKTIKF